MTIFDEREQQFENRFKHDQEFHFKVTARRNRLAGLWAAQLMGLDGAAAEAYAKEIVGAEFAGGDRHVVDKLVADLGAKGRTLTPTQVQSELAGFADQAKQQLMKE